MNKCRTCLKIPADKDISQLEKGIKDDNKKCIDIMEFCLNIKVTRGTKITTNLCNICYRKIISFYKFKVLSLKNDAYLKSLASVPSLDDQKVSVYVDVNAVKHENPLETGESGPCIEDPNIKTENVKKEKPTDIPIEIEIKDEKSFDDHIDTEDGKVENSHEEHDKPLSKLKPDKNEHIGDKHSENEVKRKKRKKPLVKQVRRRKFCEECGLSCTNLKKHSLIHQPKEGRPMLPCKDCPKLFANASGRDRHYKVKHLGEKSKCDICNKDVVYLAVHKMQMHNHAALPYGCVTCDHRFISRAALDLHMVTHTGDFAFECDKCQKKFRSKGSVTKHIRMVHMGEKNHQCEICARAFFNKIMLQEHYATHSTEQPFQCGICGKSFGTKIRLKHHSLTHSDVKNHHCEFCDMSFKLKSLLKRHMLKHTKEAPFQCRFCEKRFGRSSHRLRHERNLHQKHTLTDHSAVSIIANANIPTQTQQ